MEFRAATRNDASGLKATLAEAGSDAERIIQRLLRAVREHLGLEVAFVGEFVGNERVFRFVDAVPGVDAVAVGGADPREASYCHHVAAGDLPGFLRDPSRHPLAAALPVTSELPVGSHLSVPIRFSDGRTYGTFCCFARDVRESLDPSDLSPLRMVAELAAEYLEAADNRAANRCRRRRLISKLLDDPAGMTLATQPIRRLDTMEIVALEALARFPGQSPGPAWFFKEAADVGLGVELEMRAVRMSLAAFDSVPAPIRLNVNVSPATLGADEFFDAISGTPADRLVVEVTEHAVVDDYGDLQAASRRLAASGVWLAIDDVGMGFSGLNRILQTAPQQLKLDAVVVRDVDVDPLKQALIESFRTFADRAGLDLVAEGIETEAELAALQQLGVKLGQGYHLGRPGTLESALAGTRPTGASTAEGTHR